MRIGVTGHRTLTTPDAEWVRSVLDELVGAVDPPVVGVSALAEGADQLFADVVLAHGGSLVVVVPFSGYARRLPDAASRAAFEDMCSAASAVEILEPLGSAEAGYAAAGRRVVDLVDVVVAVWDGLPARGVGGTAEVVAYARSLGRPVVHVNPEDHSVSGREELASRG